jgi:hypothetical protein
MKWLIMLIVIAGIAAYFTLPDRETMSAAADKFIKNNSNPIETMGTQAAGAIQGRSYDSYYVVAKYTVANSVTCWGAFKVVQCNKSSGASK